MATVSVCWWVLDTVYVLFCVGVGPIELDLDDVGVGRGSLVVVPSVPDASDLDNDLYMESVNEVFVKVPVPNVVVGVGELVLVVEIDSPDVVTVGLIVFENVSDGVAVLVVLLVEFALAWETPIINTNKKHRPNDMVQPEV
eukprot:PhM_4_TR10985/c0_g1_i1/m.81935